MEAPAVGLAVRSSGYRVAFGQTAAVSSVLGQRELLAILGYLPLQRALGEFIWRWQITPATLKRMWARGLDIVVLGGRHHRLRGPRGAASGRHHLAGREGRPAGCGGQPLFGANPDGYTYAVAKESLPETLAVWRNGAVVKVSSANTGGPGAATAQGTWPVYERLRAQIMTGTDPDGAHYADPVQFVAYFHGSDAVHDIVRATDGSPQSLGCVELPLTAAAQVWPYLTYGALVTVN